MYSVSERDLDALTTSSGTFAIYLSVLGVAFGLLVSCLVTLTTVNLSTRANAAYLAIAAVMAVSVLVLAALSFKEWIDERHRRETMKREFQQ